MVNRKIDLQYILASEMIVDDMTKAFTYVKYHLFVKQMCIN